MMVRLIRILRKFLLKHKLANDPVCGKFTFPDILLFDLFLERCLQVYLNKIKVTLTTPLRFWTKNLSFGEVSAGLSGSN